MHDSDDHNLIGQISKKNAEWKCFGETSPHITIDNRIQKRIDSDAVNAVLNGG